MYGYGRGVPQHFLRAHVWMNLAASRQMREGCRVTRWHCEAAVEIGTRSRATHCGRVAAEGRKRMTAAADDTADNSRSTRGRNVLPGCRAAGRRWRPAGSLQAARERPQGTERPEDRLHVGDDLLVPVEFALRALLKPVQGALPGQRTVALANPPLSGQVVARWRPADCHSETRCDH